MAKKDKKAKASKLPEVGSEVVTPAFRVGYIGMPDDNGKYSVKAVFDKDADLAEMEALALNALYAKFGDGIDVEDYKMPWNDGDKFYRKKSKGAADASSLEYMQGTTYCNMGTQYLPTLTDSKERNLAPDDSKKLYPGMWARAIISAYAYEYADKDGVSFGLIALQHVADDEKLAAGGMSAEQVKGRFNAVPIDAPKIKGKKADKDDEKKKKKKK